MNGPKLIIRTAPPRLSNGIDERKPTISITSWLRQKPHYPPKTPQYGLARGDELRTFQSGFRIAGEKCGMVCQFPATGGGV